MPFRHLGQFNNTRDPLPANASEEMIPLEPVARAVVLARAFGHGFAAIAG